MAGQLTSEQEQAINALLKSALDARQQALRAAFREWQLWVEQIGWSLTFMIKIALGVALFEAIVVGVASKVFHEAIDSSALFMPSIMLFLIMLPPCFTFFGRNLFLERANSAFDEVLRNSPPAL
jgi:hypothetical protein